MSKPKTAWVVKTTKGTFEMTVVANPRPDNDYEGFADGFNVNDTPVVIALQYGEEIFGVLPVGKPVKFEIRRVKQS